MKLEKELEEKVKRTGGFGAPEAVEHHNREIEYLKFKITQKNNVKIAAMAATISAFSYGIFTLIFKLLSI